METIKKKAAPGVQTGAALKNDLHAHLTERSATGEVLPASWRMTKEFLSDSRFIRQDGLRHIGYALVSAVEQLDLLWSRNARSELETNPQRGAYAHR